MIDGQQDEGKQTSGKLADSVLRTLQNEYLVVGRTRVRAWHAWLLIGIAAGIAAGIILVANRSGQVEMGRAVESDETYQLAPTFSLQFHESPESKIVREASLSATSRLSEIEKASEVTKPSLIAKLQKDLQSRRKILESLIEKDPATALLSFFPPSVISRMPPAVRSEVEEPVTIEAALEVFHTDDFQNRVATYKYFLKRGNTRLEFYPAGAPLLVSSGAKVRIEGFQLGSKVVAPVADNTFRILAASPPPESIGDQRTLAVLIDFLDSPQPPPFSVTQGPALIFQGQMQAFYKEASYDQISWSGDVIGWYTVPRNGLDASGSPLWPQYGDDTSDPDGVYTYIKSQNIDLTQYQRLVLLSYHLTMNGGGGSIGKIDLLLNGQNHRVGVAVVGSLTYYANSAGQPFVWTFLDYILAHELGHTLGLPHPEAWECGARRTLYGSNCQKLAYGNPYDLMGGSNTLHLNAYYKDAMGWANQPLTISKTGVYTINALEVNSAVPFAKIYQPALNTTPYYLEYRRAVGFDANLANPLLSANQEGVFINSAYRLPFSSYLGSIPYSLLLDLSPASSASSDWFDAVLKGGRVFDDVGNGIVVGPVLNRNQTSITFKARVLAPRCVRPNPAVAVFPWGTGYPPVYVIPGELTSFAISIYNLDSLPCGASDFRSDVVLPKSWSLTYIGPNPTTVSPFGGIGVGGWITGEIQVPSSAVSGSQYSVPFTVTNTASGKNVVIPITYIVQ